MPDQCPGHARRDHGALGDVEPAQLLDVVDRVVDAAGAEPGVGVDPAVVRAAVAVEELRDVAAVRTEGRRVVEGSETVVVTLTGENNPRVSVGATNQATVTITDDQGGTSTQIIGLTVNPVDDPAVITGDTTGSGLEDGGAISGSIAVSPRGGGVSIAAAIASERPDCRVSFTDNSVEALSVARDNFEALGLTGF